MGHSGANFSVAWSPWSCISESGAGGKVTKAGTAPAAGFQGGSEKQQGSLAG